MTCCGVVRGRGRGGGGGGGGWLRGWWLVLAFHLPEVVAKTKIIPKNRRTMNGTTFAWRIPTVLLFFGGGGRVGAVLALCLSFWSVWLCVGVVW